jgi:hypothetical protein
MSKIYDAIVNAGQGPVEEGWRRPRAWHIYAVVLLIEVALIGASIIVGAVLIAGAIGGVQ